MTFRKIAPYINSLTYLLRNTFCSTRRHLRVLNCSSELFILPMSAVADASVIVTDVSYTSIDVQKDDLYA